MDTSGLAVRDPLPPKRRKRWLARAIVFSMVFLGTVAAAAPWAFSNAALRAEAASQIRRLTGLEAASLGRAVFVVLPRPHISLDDASFTDKAGTLRVSAQSLKVNLRVVSLLTGTIEIASVTLGKPEIEISLDRQTVTLDSVIGRAAHAAPGTKEAAAADAARLGSLTVVDGRAHLKSERATEGILIDSINATLDWPKPGAAAYLSGQASLRGEAATIAAWIANPAGLLRGQESGASFTIDSDSYSLSAMGSAASVPNWQFNSRLHASAPSLRAILEAAGHSVPLPAPLSDFNLGCDASIDPSNAVLSGLRLRFDDSVFEGTLAFQWRGGTPLLSGTLATTQFSLRPWLPGVSPASEREGQWSQEPFDLQRYGNLGLDLRISAGRLLLSRFDIEDAAFSILRSRGRLEAALIGAKAYQGTVKGRITVEPRGEGIGVQAAAVFSGADLAGLSFDAFGWAEIYGSMTGAIDIETAGGSVKDLMRNLSGTAHADVAHGQLGSIDLESALRRIDKRPLGLLTDIRRGRTPFERASFGLRFLDGVASIEEGVLENANLRLSFGGTVDFGDRSLDLHAVAMPPSAEPRNGTGQDFRFDITGSWDEVSFTPDVRSLIRRSGAAAPLFEQPSNGSAPQDAQSASGK